MQFFKKYDHHSFNAHAFVGARNLKELFELWTGVRFFYGSSVERILSHYANKKKILEKVYYKKDSGIFKKIVKVEYFILPTTIFKDCGGIILIGYYKNND